MKTELATVEQLAGLPLEELAVMANKFGEKCRQSAKKTVQDAIVAGTALLAAKAKCEHGEWGAWLGTHFDYDRRTAYRYMGLASNVTRVTNEEPESMAAAFRMLGNAEPAIDAVESIPPRADRIPDRVEVVESASEPDHIADTNKMVDVDTNDDPAPDPPTIRKTAKGSEKVSEDKKQKTQQVVAEIVEDDPFTFPATGSEQIQYVCDRYACQEILNVMADMATAENAKRVAKMLRKTADKIDPPDTSKSKIPASSDLWPCIPETLSEQMQSSLMDWVRYKQAHSQRTWRYQTVESWKKDLKRITNAITKKGEARVIEMLEQAESTGWRHWDHDTTADNPFSGGGRNNGHTESLADRVASKAARLKDIFG